MTDAYVPLTGPPTWHHAACRGEDPELWFADEQNNDARLMRAEAQAICAGCRMAVECLTFAVDNDIAYGIFGGRTPKERRTQIRRPERQGPRPWRRQRTEIPTKDAVCDHCDQTYSKPLSQPNQLYCSQTCAKAAHRRKKIASQRKLRVMA